MSLLPSGFIFRMEHLLTRQSWLKTGLPPIVWTWKDQRTQSVSTYSITVSRELCVNFTRHFIPCQILRLAEESLAINMGRRTELGFVRHIWLFGGTYLDVSDISGYFVEHNVDLSDKSGYSVGHIWICRIHLAFWSDTSGRVGHIWLFCRTYLVSDKSDFVGLIEPSQGLYTNAMTLTRI